MVVSKEIMKKIEGKLRRPVHLSYISRYIFKLDEQETKKLINVLVKQNIIEESKYASDYYVLKGENNNG